MTTICNSIDAITCGISEYYKDDEPETVHVISPEKEKSDLNDVDPLINSLSGLLRTGHKDNKLIKVEENGNQLNLYRNRGNNEIEVVVEDDLIRSEPVHSKSPMQEKKEKRAKKTKCSDEKKTNRINEKSSANKPLKGGIEITCEDRREQEYIDRGSDTTLSRLTASNNSSPISFEGRSVKSNPARKIFKKRGLMKKKQKTDNQTLVWKASISSEASTRSMGSTFSVLNKKFFSLKKTYSMIVNNMLDKRHHEWKIENTPMNTELNSMYIDDSKLVEFCGMGFNSPSDVRIALEKNLSLSMEVSQEGRNALHAICMKGLPIRKTRVVSLRDHSFSFDSMTTVVHSHSLDQPQEDNEKFASFRQRGIKSSSSFTDYSNYEKEHVLQIPYRVLKEDSRNLRDVLRIVLASNKEVATQVDKYGDLPVHHLTRQLWEWRKQMRPRAIMNHKKFVQFGEISDIIRECIELLLQPLACDTQSCQATGSKGILLPLHIAALFGVSFNVMEGIINGYNAASKITCDNAIKGIKNMLPLHLFEKKQFFRWNVNENQTSNFQRTSDLIFFSNPSILPYRREPDRLKRVENWIRKEATSCDSEKQLNHDVKVLWTWMCTFINEKDLTDHYANSVEMVLSALDGSSVKKLLGIKLEDEKEMSLLDIAVSPCADILSNYAKIADPQPEEENSHTFFNDVNFLDIFETYKH